MNDVSGITQAPVRNGLGVALLIDGENVSYKHAKDILDKSLKRGAIAVKRVYGDITKMPGWTQTPGFQFVHSGNHSGNGNGAKAKNSADMLLTIDAMDLALNGAFGTFIIVSSDRDFSHLAHYLRGRHLTVIGVGKPDSAPMLKESYTFSAELKAVENKNPVKQVAKENSDLDRKLCELISEESEGLLVSRVNGLIRRSLDIKISERPEKTWPNYFAKNEKLYDCDPKGPNARVRLKPL